MTVEDMNDRISRYRKSVENYCYDLASMHAAERDAGFHSGPTTVRQHPDGVDYWNALNKVLEEDRDSRINVCATAKQRARAFIHVLKLT